MFTARMKKQRNKYIATSCIVLILIALGVFKFSYNENDGEKIEEQAQIEKRYLEFYNALKNKEFGIAYSIMSPQYRNTKTLDQFSENFNFASQNWLQLKPGRSISINKNKAFLYPRESEFSDFWSGPEYEWIKINNIWYLTGEYKWYYD